MKVKFIDLLNENYGHIMAFQTEDGGEVNRILGHILGHLRTSMPSRKAVVFVQSVTGDHVIPSGELRDSILDKPKHFNLSVTEGDLQIRVYLGKTATIFGPTDKVRKMISVKSSVWKVIEDKDLI